MGAAEQLLTKDTEEHFNLAFTLCALDGNDDRFETERADLAAALEQARVYARA